VRKTSLALTPGQRTGQRLAQPMFGVVSVIQRSGKR